MELPSETVGNNFVAYLGDFYGKQKRTFCDVETKKKETGQV